MSANGKSWWATIATNVSRWSTNSRILRHAACILLFASLITPAAAQNFANAPTGEIDRVTGYLNSIRSFSSRFVQANADGGYVEGLIRVERPGKMRIDYDPPSPYLVVADGLFFIFVDQELEEVSHIPLSLTAAQFVLRDDLGIGLDIEVAEYRHRAGLIEMTIRSAEEPEAGSVTLTLNEEPLMLRQWTVVDGQGLATHVTLVDPIFNNPQDPEAFVFVNPWATRDEQGK